MKLAFVLHQYFPYGGLQRDAMAIALACEHAGHQVEFLCMSWEGDKNPRMPVHLFPKKHWIGYRRYASFEKSIHSYIKKNHYDGVIGFNKMQGLDVYYAADPCFAANMDKCPKKWFKKYLPRYCYFLQAEKALCKSDTKILLISPQQHKDFQHYYQIPDTRLHLLPPGIDKSRCWKPDAPSRRLNRRKKLNLKPFDKMLLSIGSSFKTKGIDRNLLALSALPSELRSKTHLWVVGKGDSTPFEKMAETLGIKEQVHFILGSDEIPDLLQAADLLLHSSYLESAGMAIVEAIVAGLPVLVTGNCGYAFYVEKAQAGCVLLEPFEQEVLNQRLVFMLTSDDSLWRKKGIQFGQQQDLYSMPEKASQLIEQFLISK